MKTPLLLILALCVSFPSTCLAADLPQSFRTGDGFTMHLPADWKPIPRQVLDAYSDAMAKLAPQAGKQTFSYGYQRAASGKWFDYPYILVQVNRSGRVPEEQLQSLAQIEKAMDQGFDRTRKSLSSIVDNLTLGRSSYDPSSHILWTAISLDIKGFGAVRGIIGSLLTEEGFIQISCQSRKQDFAGYLPLFEAIVRNAELDPALAYKPRTGEPGRWGSKGAWIGTLAAVALLGGLAALVFGYRRRRKDTVV